MKKILISIIMTSIVIISEAQIPVKGLVAWYPFNGNANNYAQDSCNGKVNGATLTTDRFGNPNAAYSFDGVSNNILIHSDSILAPFSKKIYTVSLWVNYKKDGMIMQIFTGTNGQNISNYDLAVNNGKLGFVNYPFYQVGTSSTDSISKNTWVYLLVSYDLIKDTVSIFENTNLVLKAPLSNTPPKAGLISIGSLINNQGAFNGSIDDIRVYNRVLSAGEITALYNENLCTNNITVTDTLKISSVTGVNSLPTDFGVVKAYPNPAHDILNISVSNPTNNYSIQILNNLGTVVYSSVLSSPNTQINIGSLTKGLYFVKIIDMNNKILDVRKLVLE